MLNRKTGTRTISTICAVSAKEQEQQKKNKAVYTSEHFKRGCEVMGIPVTKRQASKYNNSKGLVYKLYNS